ncbi:carboxypeptidase regulatory-like domain-containing protein, partial [Candidatus Uhrbacteria bacterium]|nr:carboxypeptidase regulatory-like domain-containing protein [Candidatus Uhrbacteria bacterium]
GYSGFKTARISVKDNIINAPIELIALLPPLSEEIKSIRDVFPALSRRAVNSVQIVRQNAAVQQSANVAAPVVAFTAVSTVTLLATSFNAIRFLQYMFTAPFLLFKRRRRKKWGVVYDSLRKLPVDLAIVRLIDVATNKPFKSQVTDKQGRFLFVVDPGVYKIEVRKEGFIAPTSHLKDLKIDGNFLDLYHGENIEVNEQSSAIAVNVPVDPSGQDVTVSKKAVVGNCLRKFMYGFSVVGVIVATGVAVIDPSPWTISLAVGQVLILGLFLKLAIPKKPTSWGIVYDEKTRRPLARAIVRIFDPKYNKLLETKITDSRGRYAFLVGPSEFYATYEKPGFQKVEVRPIDRTDTNEPSYVSMDIPLNKFNNK